MILKLMSAFNDNVRDLYYTQLYINLFNPVTRFFKRPIFKRHYSNLRKKKKEKKKHTHDIV
jgi:hypothetical protein